MTQAADLGDPSSRSWLSSTRTPTCERIAPRDRRADDAAVAFWGSVVPLYRQRHRRTLELLHIALRLAKYAEMNFKHALCVRRPHEYSPQIQPIIQTPDHGALPSGHATEAFIVARLLLELVSQAAPASPEVVQLRQLPWPRQHGRDQPDGRRSSLSG